MAKPLDRPRRPRASALVLALLLASSSAEADDLADEAGIEFELGTERYAAGDYKAALRHFLASNRLAPNKNVLFNVARTYEQLGRAPDAYRYYLLALEGERDPATRARIEESLERIRPDVAVLRVETDPPGARVFLDRRELGSRGLSPLRVGVGAGSYKILVDLEGHEPAEVSVPEAKPGTETPVRVELEPILGTLQVLGEPKGTTVRSGSEAGPVVGEVPGHFRLKPGRKVLVFQKEGYQSQSQVVDVPARGEVTVELKLVPRTGSLVVDADEKGALITVDGRPSGFTPAVVTVPVGPHRVRVAQPGFRPHEVPVTVRENQQTRIDARLERVEEVTAASRNVEATVDAPASVTIVSGQEIRAMGYPTIAEAVRGVRGVYLSDDRHYETVGIRGFSRPGDYGNRVLVLLDGHPTNDNYVWSSYVGFDARVDLEDVERIEVIRGPGSVLYGTGAFFGVINVITRDRSQPTHTEVGVSTALGAARGRVAQVIRFSKDAGLWVSAAGARSPGRDFFFPDYVSDPRDPEAETDASGRPSTGEARGVDGFDAVTLSGRAFYKSLTASAFLHSRDKALPTGAFETVFADPRTRFVDTRAFLEAKVEPKVGERLELMSRAHADLYNFDGVYAYPRADGGVFRDRYRGRWAGFEQRLALVPGRGARVTLGGEVKRHFSTEQESFFSAEPEDRLLDRNDPFTVAAAYLLGDFVPAKSLRVSAGVRLDYYSNQTNVDVSSLVNPRLALIYRPYEGGNLKLIFGKAFRAPSVYELFYEDPGFQIRPPPDFQPEQVYSGELEFSHRFSPSVTGTLAGYSNYVTSLIGLRDVTDPSSEEGTVVQYQNSEAPVLVVGGEAEVRRDFRQGWMLAASYSAQQASYVGEAGSALREVPNSPNHLASLKGAAPIAGRYLRLASRLSFEGPRFDRNDRASDPAQERTDAGLVWDLVFSGETELEGLRYSFGAYNVFDWRYETPLSHEFRQRALVQNGRTLLASLSASF